MKELLLFAFALTLLSLVSCAKKISLSAPQTVTELQEQYQSLKRTPISASFLAISSKGFFQGELYLEAQPELLALVYAYLPIGEPLFQLIIKNDYFLYLEFSAKRAYSNQKDWLQDYEIGQILEEQDLIQLLSLLLQALAGEIPPEAKILDRKGNQVILVSNADSKTKLEYVFKTRPFQLMQVAQSGDSQSGDFNFQAEFVYQDCWFPAQIQLKNGTEQILLTFSRLNCQENQKPELKFRVPSGFKQILIERF